MVDEVVTKQELIDAQKDAQSLDDFINGSDEQIVITRLLEEYPTLANVIRQVYEKGGKFYPTLAAANADIANIRTDVYVITGDNGAYYKATAGATTLTKSDYDPLEQAKADATTKANIAKSEAISAAATDATTKANAAQQAAAVDATTKANTAKTEAIATAATDATSKANAAKSEAIEAAATNATTKANAAEANAKADATTKANTAQANAISAAATDATTKANTAEANAKAYVDEKIKITLDDPEYILCISDSDSNLLFAITRQGELIGDFKILLENISDLPTVLTLKDNFEGELYEIVDPQGNILARVESDGTWVLPAIRTSALDSTEITGDNPALTNLILKDNFEGELYEIVDPQGNILAQVEPDGTWVLPAIRTSTLGSSELTVGNSELTNLTLKDNVEGELYEVTDPQGNILAQVEPDGTWVLPAIRTTTLDSTEITGGNLNLGESTEPDITKENLIRIPEQNYLRLDLSFVNLPTDASEARTPTAGTCIISDSSKSIVYARTNAELSVQGHGSASDKKRNYSIDFYNVDGDELELKFGDSIASDSYHLKGFYRDPSHMRDQGGYRCWKELVKKLDYPYSKINNIVYSASPSRPTNAEFTADAKYYPHGFPVEVYLNSAFYGLYTLRLKKSRNNYALDNSNTDHIFLDSGTYTALLKEPFDASDWEIKSPKMKDYDDLGPIPPAFTETVGASCTRLFEFTSTLSTSYVNHADYIVLPHWVLWYLMCELTGDWDHNGNNYNIITWNNQQWSIIPYDLDWTLNWSGGSGNIQSHNLLSTDIWATFRTVFTPEIEALWTKHRKNGDISVENIVKHYRGAVGDIPRDVYKADKEKWGSYSSFENVNYPDLEQVYMWFEARIAYLDSKYLIS